MFSLKKRKKEDEEYEDEYEQSPRRHRSKDFKDLNPENKKRRKEPKKPWGKKERLFVLITILLTAGASFFLGLSSFSWKLQGLPRLSFPTLTMPSLLEEETIVVERSNNLPSQDAQRKEKGIGAFKDMTKTLAGVYGLYVVDLNSQFAYGVNETEVFQAASLIKLPVMAKVFMESEKGNLNLDSVYKLKGEDKVPGAGSLFTKPVGYEITYRDLLQLMGKQSDNTAFNILRKILGDEKINEAIKEIGMTKTSLEENKTTPYDIGIFFERLWNGNLISEKNKEYFLRYLTDTLYESWLAAGIPKEIRVAHKYGRELHVVNDAGIIFANKPFVVVIMSQGVIESEADAIFPELSKTIYDIETSY